jgi:hypothetical protein
MLQSIIINLQDRDTELKESSDGDIIIIVVMIIIIIIIIIILYPFLLYRPLMVSRLFFSLDLYTIGRTPWTSDRPVARPLPKHRASETQNNAHTQQTSMPEVGFEPTITASARAKTVHALDRSATVTGIIIIIIGVRAPARYI